MRYYNSIYNILSGGSAEADIDAEAKADADASLDAPSFGSGAAVGVDLGGLSGLGAGAE